MSVPHRWVDEGAVPGPAWTADGSTLDGATADPASGTVAAFAAEHLPALDLQFAGLLASAGRLGEPYRKAVAVALGIEGVSGRRWRPLLVLAAAEALGRDPAEVAGLAAAVELTHTASLVLDDMPCMDDSELRRGTAATHARIGQEGAILLAVACLGTAAERLGGVPAGSGPICRDWGEVIGLDGMSGGQAMDLFAVRTGGLQGDRRRLHRKKSTALPAFALSAAAQALEASAATERSLAAVGRDLGWAYQLADDAHDRFEDGSRGLVPGGLRPERQSRRLLARARRRLDATPELRAKGRQLLDELAVLVVTGHDTRTGGPA